MYVVQLPPPPVQAPMVRCECIHCGAHVKVRRSWQLSGQCRNCGSYEVRALPTRVAALDHKPAVDVPFAGTRVA